MPEISVPDETEAPQRTVTEGYFEEELYLDAESAGAFLVELGHQLQESEEITLTGDGWELPFTFSEPIELDIELQGKNPPELEIELELEGRADHDPPSIS